MKTKSKMSGHIIRSVVYAVFLSVAFIALTSAFNSPNAWDKSANATGGYDRMAKSPSQPRAFSFVERVVFQRAIEDVYWHHRIWPNENSDPKPALDAVMSQAQLENKVAGYLRDSLMLQQHWQKPITAEQLQAEMDRMARDTKQLDVLQELFEALGNDPAVIAECLARPILAQRLIADFSAQDQTQHIESPQSEALGAMSAAATLGQVVYTLPKIAEAGDPSCTDEWTATTTSNVPQRRSHHAAVWTGTEMIVWGGAPYTSTGGRYNPSTDSWIATSMTNAPSARAGHTAVWTGTEMIVWGGAFYDFEHFVNTGGKYNPSTDSWTSTSLTNAPSARRSHTAVWTGSEMIVWGGYDPDRQTNNGGRYDPETDSWIATSPTNAPTARSLHTAVWTGSEMIVWGGRAYPGPIDLNTGGRYNPGTDSWTTTSMTNAPTAREQHTAVWTGSEMIVWGGGTSFNTGRRYDPGTDSWIVTSITNAPSGRYAHTAVWTGGEMIIWGGLRGPTFLRTGGRYNPGTDSWAATSRFNAPDRRYSHTAIWTGSEMIVWGGVYYIGSTNTGGRYCGPPSNDDFADAIMISTTSGSLVGTNKGSTTEVGEPAGENSVWYRWVPASTGDAQFRIGMDWLKITVYTGAAIDALTQVAVSSGTPSSVNWTAVAGTAYQIRLTKNTRTSAFTLVWSPPPPNDAFASAILLTGANGTLIGTNVNATDQSAFGEPAGENSVWYEWNPPSNGTAHFQIGMDWLEISVYTGSTIGGLTHVATSSGSPSAVTWTAVEGTTYRIRLYKKTRTSDFHLFWTL